MKKLLFVLVLLLTSPAFAQDKIPITENDYQNNTVEMADLMRSNGKIYVVVAIVSIVLAGLLLYVFVVDRKVSLLERELQNIQDQSVDS